MNLYLVPNDPERAVLVSTNGVAQYKVTTSKPGLFGSPAITTIMRPADNEADSLVAEIEWRRWGKHPVVRSNVFDGSSEELEVREFLYKVGSTFSSTRYFLGNDDEEYRWKLIKGIGQVLTNRRTRDEIACFTQDTVKEGYFQGEQKWFLEIQPTGLDIDLIVLTFLIMEKRRRDREADPETVGVYHDEDPCEGGCGET